jgi:RecB family endonuclease NucS
MAVQTGPEAPLQVFALDPAGLRRLLGRQPELLEPGLSVFTDEKGRPVGAGYSTRVGEIDLLARDKSGTFVVVRVADREGGEELVAETLQRIGWVRKHLGKGKQKARGIILVEQAPENLSYTAAGVAGTITFKTYRIAVAFEDVEIE